jgi:DNA-directed RNA polymerase subunit alpha
MTSADFEIMNPELHLATLDSSEAQLSVEFNIEQGKGYAPATSEDGLPIGVLPVDAIFTPVKRVNYSVERTRVGQVTDYELLIMEIWTDETISPVEAISRAGQILVDRFFLFANTGRATGASNEKPFLALSVPADVFNTPVEKLELSARTLNCLKRAHINRVGEILEQEKADLLKIRNFGEKSLDELYSKLDEMGFIPQNAKPQDGSAVEDPDDVADAEEGEPREGGDELEALR